MKKFQPRENISKTDIELLNLHARINNYLDKKFSSKQNSTAISFEQNQKSQSQPHLSKSQSKNYQSIVTLDSFTIES
jgi:hypothetical protein